MDEKREAIILIDLPTFPKGVMSLSLLSVAACLTEKYEVQIVDLNLIQFNEFNPAHEHVIMYGIKVSSQNLKQAVSLSKRLKEANPDARIVWGGELPSLMPDLCLQYADCAIGGLFEPVADSFISDLKTGVLKERYFGKNEAGQYPVKIDFNFLPNEEDYYQFMGYPLETSRGCTENCMFCMVLVMQKKNYNIKNAETLKKSFSQYRGKFINVVDYNFGVSPEHVKEIAGLIKENGALGWMAEMCIELLDNDEVLVALKDSRCKMIYCGLESIDQQALDSINKLNTNHIQNYERIIRKVQSYGIQVAAGIIIGLEGTHENTFEELYKFYHRMGIIYAKLTFLIYNPGTKVQEYMRKKGVFLTDDISCYDGNQLSYLPYGVDADHVLKGSEKFIQKYYSLGGIISRSFNTQLSALARAEYILFNLCYRMVYLDWLEHDTLHNPENIHRLVDRPFVKSSFTLLIERTLNWVRKKRMNG